MKLTAAKQVNPKTSVSKTKLPGGPDGTNEYLQGKAGNTAAPPTVYNQAKAKNNQPLVDYHKKQTANKAPQVGKEANQVKQPSQTQPGIFKGSVKQLEAREEFIDKHAKSKSPKEVALENQLAKMGQPDKD